MNKENQNKRIILIVIVVIIILIIILGVKNANFKNEKQNEITKNNLTPMSKYEFPSPTPITEKKILKVLIIEIDPILTKGKINGLSCVNKTASECLKQDKKKVVDELIEDIEYSSHGIIDVQIVDTFKVNEFPTNKTKATMKNGNKSNKLDQDTWLSIMKNGWYGFWDSEVVKEFGSYVFDYEYLIKKANLVERRNKNEFNEVWLVNVDPIANYESMMVGKTAYWINGEPIIKDCENFRIMNVSISRPDSNFECNGHAAENIMKNVFETNTSLYNENEVSIDRNNYIKLSLWEKFTLNEHANKIKKTGLNGPGNVHFSPNSITDYDWSNFNNKVISKWKEWEEYPNLTNKPGTEYFDPNIYISEKITGTNDVNRTHHRWWFSLMPHVSGYTYDGYSNNWWDYLYLSDYVSKVEGEKYNYTYNINEDVDDITIKNTYISGKEENIVLDKYTNNMFFTNKEIFSIDEEGKIVATSKGESLLKYNRDGKYVTISIIIK